MSTARPPMRTPLVVLASIGALSLLIGGLLLLRRAVTWALSYGDFCAIGFLVMVTAWGIWVTMALLSRPDDPNESRRR